MLTGLGHQPPL